MGVRTNPPPAPMSVPNAPTTRPNAASANAVQGVNVTASERYSVGPSTGSDRVGGVGELVQLAGHHVGDLLADVDGVVADPLDAAGDDEHAQAVLALLGRVAEREHVLDRVPVRAVDQLVELLQRARLLDVAVAERVERDADHLLGALAHVLDRGEDRLAGDVQVAHQLRQLGHGDGVVRHPLEVEVDAQHREHEAQVARDRRLPREQRLHALLDPEVAAVDLVVEADHLVGELVVAPRERVQRRAQRAQDERSLLVDGRLELRQLVLKRLPQPNRPVTYPSVRESDGCVKILSVESYSTRMPWRLPSSSTCRLKNAVISATRAACCMLCVTITSV